MRRMAGMVVVVWGSMASGCGDKHHEGAVRLVLTTDAQRAFSASSPGAAFLVVGEGSGGPADSDLAWQGHVAVLCDAVVEDVIAGYEIDGIGCAEPTEVRAWLGPIEPGSAPCALEAVPWDDEPVPPGGADVQTRTLFADNADRCVSDEEYLEITFE